MEHANNITLNAPNYECQSHINSAVNEEEEEEKCAQVGEEDDGRETSSELMKLPLWYL